MDVLKSPKPAVQNVTVLLANMTTNVLTIATTPKLTVKILAALLIPAPQPLSIPMADVSELNALLALSAYPLNAKQANACL